MTRPLTLVKLGGSLITEKGKLRTVRRDVLASVAGEIAEAVADGHRLVLAHGSGSFGHPEALKAGLADGLTDDTELPGVYRTQAAARDLHREVLSTLLDAGVTPYSLLPGSLLVSESGIPANLFVEPILLALGVNLVPVLCGDVVLDRDRGVWICSTESLFLAIASRLVGDEEPIGRIVWVGATPGIYDRHGETIPRLDRESWAAQGLEDAAPEGDDVTGGVVLRVETALGLAELGIPSIICDGRERGRLRAALDGESAGGTLVPARPR